MDGGGRSRLGLWTDGSEVRGVVPVGTGVDGTSEGVAPPTDIGPSHVPALGPIVEW